MQKKTYFHLQNQYPLLADLIFTSVKINQLLKQKKSIKIKMSTKHVWTIQEDLHLKTLAAQQEKINWNNITKKINERFADKERTSKQCRQRYINYSLYSQISGSLTEWSHQEVQTLFQQFGKWGTRWTKISHSLPGKSENSIKNKFYGGLRKAIRKINQIGKIQFRKLKKKIRYQSVVRVIEAAQCFHNLDNKLRQESISLREKIFEIIKCKEADIQKFQIAKLIDDMNKFNLATRSYRAKKSKKFNDDDAASTKTVHQNNEIRVPISMKEQNILQKLEVKQQDGSNTFGSPSMEQFQIRNSYKIANQDQKMRMFDEKGLIFFQSSNEIRQSQDNHYCSQLSNDLLNIFAEQCSPFEGSDLY